jgi:hypothetical protein
VLAELEPVAARAAIEDDLLLAHDHGHVAAVRELARQPSRH